MNLNERIENKQKQITKMEKNLVKYAKEVDEEFIKMCDRYFETKDYSELRDYKISHNMCFLPEYYSKRYDLEDAKATLEKYQKQLIKENEKKSTLNELPEVIVKFRDNLIESWNNWDIAFRESVKVRYDKIWKLYEDGNRDEYRNQYRLLSQECGGSISETMRESDEEINAKNIKAAETVILNMINRVIEITGKITDAKYLYMDRDNQGYSIINGKIIGEKGSARIESIGAGGYNIQRYHIRVLVKEVK